MRTLLQVLESLPQPLQGFAGGKAGKGGPRRNSSLLPPSVQAPILRKQLPPPRPCATVSLSLWGLWPCSVGSEATSKPSAQDWRGLSLLPFSFFLTLISGRLSSWPPLKCPFCPWPQEEGRCFYFPESQAACGPEVRGGGSNGYSGSVLFVINARSSDWPLVTGGVTDSSEWPSEQKGTHLPPPWVQAG